MKKIPLSKEQVALVDDQDYEWLMQWKWRAVNREQRDTKYSAKRASKTPKSVGKRRTIDMARQIMNAPEGMEVDHIDGNPLNNQRHNLRLVTHHQNLMNSSKYKPNGKSTSEFKGVSWIKDSKKWRAMIQPNRICIVIGYFQNEIDAAIAYDNAARDFYGKFAKLNFPEKIDS